MATLRFLYIGDVVGKAGRAAVTQLLPGLRSEFKLDAVCMNAENMAHGNGISEATVNDMHTAGVDYFSSGNHIFDNKDGVEYLKRSDCRVIRPANFPKVTPGKGYITFEVGTKKVLLINLAGQVFMPQQVDSPFYCVDEILKQFKREDFAAILVDIHAEATSEKQALAWYLDGRVSMVVGTHTHVPTADLRILKQGTGLVCDLGSVAAADSVLGADKAKVLNRFLTQMPGALAPVETGSVFFNSVLIEIDSHTGQTVHLERVDRVVGA